NVQRTTSNEENVIAQNWQALIKPSKIDVSNAAHNPNVGTIAVEPLERGFGHTLGNALRRVLLSSLQGAAVTTIRIENVLHEFSSVAGVREDVTNIVLNVKDLRIKAGGTEKRRLSLKATGPGEVRAGQIETPADV